VCGFFAKGVGVMSLEVQCNLRLLVRAEFAEDAKPTPPMLRHLMVNPRTRLLKHCHTTFFVGAKISA
jgi:hypothetical protein